MPSVFRAEWIFFEYWGTFHINVATQVKGSKILLQFHWYSTELSLVDFAVCSKASFKLAIEENNFKQWQWKVEEKQEDWGVPLENIQKVVLSEAIPLELVADNLVTDKWTIIEITEPNLEVDTMFPMYFD